MKTRDRIVETARELFNEQGTRAVTTNHIAKAMGISPGNLYYHFRNKEEIIRAIFEEMDAYGMAEYRKVAEKYPSGSLESMERTFVMIQEFNWRYRFFKRELPALIMNDPQLRERFRISHRALLAVVRQAVDQAADADLFTPMNDTERSLLAEEIWLVALYWLTYLEVGGEEVNEATLRRGVDLLRNALRPRLTPPVPAKPGAAGERSRKGK